MTGLQLQGSLCALERRDAECTGGGGSRDVPIARPRASSLPAPIRVRAGYAAPAARVFDAWLDPGVATQFLFATALQPAARVQIDPRVAGRFCIVERRGVRTTAWRGTYVEITPPRRLVFTLHLGDDDAPSRVQVDIAPLRIGCELVLVHDGVPAGQSAALAQRWTGILYGLGATLEDLAAPTPWP